MRPSICRRVTFVACSRGVFPFVSSQACSFPTDSSCVVAGGSTATVSRVAGPMLAKAKLLFLNSATPSAAASYSEDAETVTVCVMFAPSVNDTRQVLDTIKG
jgi:hypothetical protein